MLLREGCGEMGMYKRKARHRCFTAFVVALARSGRPDLKIGPTDKVSHLDMHGEIAGVGIKTK